MTKLEIIFPRHSYFDLFRELALGKFFVAYARRLDSLFTLLELLRVAIHVRHCETAQVIARKFIGLLALRFIGAKIRRRIGTTTDDCSKKHEWLCNYRCCDFIADSAWSSRHQAKARLKSKPCDVTCCPCIGLDSVITSPDRLIVEFLIEFTSS